MSLQARVARHLQRSKLVDQGVAVNAKPWHITVPATLLPEPGMQRICHWSHMQPEPACAVNALMLSTIGLVFTADMCERLRDASSSLSAHSIAHKAFSALRPQTAQSEATLAGDAIMAQLP